MSGNKKENLFAKLAQQTARTEIAPAIERAAELEAPPEVAADEIPPSPTQVEPPPEELPKPKPPAARKKAEPVTGKRTNPDYCQANAYIPKVLRRDVERELLDIEGLDYSSLVEDLLRKWLKSKGKSA
jgi:hypothetical protein